jgi:DNA-binding response OmpR family regulator
VFLTASAESNLRDESLELGADAFVRKPFNVDHLVGTIQSLVGDES